MKPRPLGGKMEWCFPIMFPRLNQAKARAVAAVIDSRPSWSEAELRAALRAAGLDENRRM